MISAIWIIQNSTAGSCQAASAYLLALSQIKRSCQLVVVVNGGGEPDKTLLELLQQSNLGIVITRIHRLVDESTAIRAGLGVCSGDIVVLLPAYRQVDESAIADMIEQLDNGYDYVASWRNPRIDSKWSGWKSSMFNALARRMTGVKLHDLNSGLRAFRRQVIEDLPFYAEMHRFLPILGAMQGFRVTEIPVKHIHERVRKGDFRIGVYMRRALDLLSLFFLFKFVKKPLRFFGLVGNFFLAAGSVVVLYTVIERIFGVSLANRPALLFGVLMVVLGVQLFSLGLLGELIIFVHGRHVRDQFVETIYSQSKSGDSE